MQYDLNPERALQAFNYFRSCLYFFVMNTVTNHYTVSEFLYILCHRFVLIQL